MQIPAAEVARGLRECISAYNSAMFDDFLLFFMFSIFIFLFFDFQFFNFQFLIVENLKIWKLKIEN